MKNFFWQVIVLAENLKAKPASSKIAIDLKNMIAGILSVSFPEGVNINFCIHSDFPLSDLFDTTERRNSLGISETPTLLTLRLIHPSENFQDSDNRKIISIGNGSLKLLLLESFEDVDMSSRKTVSSVFKICNSGVSFQKSLVLTFDHGNAFGIFRSQSNNESLLKHINPYPIKERLHTKFQTFDLSDRIKYPSPFKLFSHPESENHEKLSPYFTMDEMALVISESGFPDEKVDVLIMLNCFMMSMDTLYALRNSVKFFVAAQTAICFYGYHYQSIFSLLAENYSTITADTLATHAVLSIEESPEYEKHPRYLGKLALFGAELSVYNNQKIWDIENLLFDKLTGLSSKKVKQAKQIRRNIWSVTFTASLNLDLLLIDTIGWFEACKQIVEDNEYEEALEYLKLSIYQMMGGEHQRSFIGGLIPKMQKMPINGTSNYMPFRASDLKFNSFKWFYEKDPTNYAKQTKLWKMIKDFYSGLN